MKGQGGGGTAKGGGKSRSGGGSSSVTKSKDLKTKALGNHVLTLRSALFTSTGQDKNVTEGIAPAFLNYNRNGINVSVSLKFKLTIEEEEWAFRLIKTNMEEIYEASGYGWDDNDKRRELNEPGGRYLFIYQQISNDDGLTFTRGKVIGFAHFRFTVQGDVLEIMAGEPILFLWDIHLEENYQRKGIGRHILTLLELIARKQGMSMLALPIFNDDTDTLRWLSKSKGFSPDSSLALMGFDNEEEGFEVYAKVFQAPSKPSIVVPSSSSSTVKSSAKVDSSPVKEISSIDVNPSDVDADTDTDVQAVATTSESEFQDEDDDTSPVDLNDVDESALVNQLKELFLTENKREATEEEVQQWIATFRDATQNPNEDK